MTSTISPASDITAWVESLPASLKFTETLTDRQAAAPTLPDVPGWTLFLWPSGNLWKVTGRHGSIGINVDRLTADQVNTFNPVSPRPIPAPAEPQAQTNQGEQQ